MSQIPVRLSVKQCRHINPDIIDDIKMTECVFYNECLTTADKGKWANFSCRECNAYQEIDAEQKAHDTLWLLALEQAAENAEKGGSAGRKRGTKGANPPLASRLRQIEDAIYETAANEGMDEEDEKVQSIADAVEKKLGGRVVVDREIEFTEDDMSEETWFLLNAGDDELETDELLQAMVC